MPLSSYNYSPLQSDHHTRLLLLSLTPEDWPLLGNIFEVDFDTNPFYYALSYVWGDSEKPHQIQLGRSYYMCITWSLYHALRDLRAVANEQESRAPLAIWADAICINQCDIQERGQQVAIMGNIYRKASKVITYIGEGTRDTTVGIEFALRIMDWSMKYLDDPPDARVNDPQKMTEIGLPGSDDPGWDALISLMRHPWSSRAWIIQEFMFNEHTPMFCGRSTFSEWLLTNIAYLRSLGLLPENMGRPRCLSDVEIHRFASVNIIGALRKQLWDEGFDSFTLLELLRFCHGHLSGDPRDKVYSLLGFARDSKVLSIAPDYTLTVAGVFTHTAARIIQCYRSIEILRSVATPRRSDLPSWVPDWSTVTTSLCLADKDYQACAERYPTMHLDAAVNRLTLSGAIVDRVLCSSGKLYDLLEGQGLSYIGSWLEPHIRTPYPTGECAAVVLCRTLCADVAEGCGDVILRPRNYLPCSKPQQSSQRLMACMLANFGGTYSTTQREGSLVLLVRAFLDYYQEKAA